MNCSNVLKLFSAFLLLLYSLNGISQDSSVVLNGTVKDQDGAALHLASISIITADSMILDFALTNDKGFFEIQRRQRVAPSPKWIEAGFIGFRKQRLIYQPHKRNYNFILERDSNMLSEVVVKNKPKLQQFGDTLRYIVSAFAKDEDRSIGDVLRRMPGILVDADGAIYHNGKKIENLYIDGDDLMSGAYGAATKVVRKEMIESVDVIQNHQPIKVLKDKVFSDKTSINLVLKDENSIKLTGSMKAGLGIPSLYDFSANGILLNKKIKSINTISANNAGTDYSNELKKLGNANLVQDLSSSSSKVDLSLASIDAPPVPQEYYYLNRSALANLNNLYNFNNGIQVKLNVQGLVDRNSLFYQSITKNYLGTDTIDYSEQQNIINKPSVFNSAFNISVNKEQYFLNNTLQYSWSQNRNKGLMYFNSTDFEQRLSTNANSFSNDFNWVPSFGKKNMLEFRWRYADNNQKESLLLSDGFYSNISGYEGFYDEVRQKVNEPLKQSNAFVSYKRVKTKGTIDVRAGWLYEKQMLYSRLYFTDNDSVLLYEGDKGNDLQWTKNNFYLRGSYDMKLGKWEGSVAVPLILQTINYHQHEYHSDNRRQSRIANPELNFRYNFTQEKYLSFHYNYSNDFGNYTQLYRGAILLNYRSLQANDADLRQNKTQSASIDYYYGKSIKLFFFNAGMSYRKIQSNTITSSIVSENLEKIILLPLPNEQHTFSGNAGTSKFLYFIKTNSTFNLSYQRGTTSQLLNNNLIDVRTNAWLASIKLNKRFGEYLSVDYNGAGNWNNLFYNDIAANINQQRFSVNQSLIFGIIGVKKMLIDFSLKHAYAKQAGNNAVKYFFADSRIRYTPANKKFDFTAQLSNLFNVKRYTLFTTDLYKLSSSEFNLRGRTILFMADYYF